MKELGCENVHFLDLLHAKIYIGQKAALVGSCNLSDNGMARLFECAVVVEDINSLHRLQNTFDNFKKEAKEQYPNAESKMNRLRVLKKQWDTAEWHCLTNEHELPSASLLGDYKSVLDIIHVVWYRPGNFNFDSNAIGAVVPDASGISPSDYFSETFQFLEEDPINPGDWVLCWPCKNDGYPMNNGRISWVQVNHVVPHGIIDEPYTKLVGQARNLKRCTPPFNIDTETIVKIKKALTLDRFSALRLQGDSVWHLASADAITQEFLEHIRRQI